MKVKEYKEMENWLTRKPIGLSKEKKKEIVKDFYEPKSKPMNILKYADTISNLYADAPPPKTDAHYDAVVAKAKQEYALKKKLENTSGYVDQFGNRESPTDRIQEMDRTNKKKIIKVAKKELPKDYKPKYLNGNVIDITPMIDDEWWLRNEIDAPEEGSRLLLVPKSKAEGIESILYPYKRST